MTDETQTPIEPTTAATPVDDLPFAVKADVRPKARRAATKPSMMPPEAVVAEPANPNAAEPAQTAIEEQSMDTINTAETIADTATSKGEAMFADMNSRAKGAMEKSSKMIEDVNAFGKGNVEALVESSKIAAKGAETLGQDAADYARRSFEASTAAIKTLATVKSPTEFMKLHSDFVRQSFDAMVAETSRSTEAMLKLAGEVTQPISNRFAVAADKMKVVA